MINIERKDNEVILKVTVDSINHIFFFTFNAGNEWAAKALFKLLGEALRDRVQGIRRDEYEQGVRDARKKKAERKDWFDNRLDKN